MSEDNIKSTKTVVSKNVKKNRQMVIIKTPVKGVKNRVGKQYFTSVTKHELINKPKKKSKAKDEKKESK